MITRNEHGTETRQQYLMRVMLEFISQHWEIQELGIDYDGDTWDGSCLADDIKYVLEDDFPEML